MRNFILTNFAQQGGLFEMVQLWVNLPAQRETTNARYQALRAADIPQIALEDNAGHIRIIAGETAGSNWPCSELLVQSMCGMVS